MKYGTIKGISHYIFDSDDEISNFFGGNPPTIVNDWRNGVEEIGLGVMTVAYYSY